MVYCPNCGAENVDNSKYCVSCGQSMGQSTSPQPQSYGQASYGQPTYGQPSSKYMQSQFSPGTPYFYAQIPKRNYLYYIAPLGIGIAIFVVFILSLFSGGGFVNYNTIFPLLGIGILLLFIGGIVMLVYYYHNGDDFRNMVNKYHPNVYPTPQDPILMVVLIFVFQPAFIYFKYQQLHDHFKRWHPEIQNPASSPWVVLGITILPTFLMYFSIFALYSSSLIGYLFILPVLGFLGFLYMEYHWQEVMNQHINFHENPQQTA